MSDNEDAMSEVDVPTNVCPYELLELEPTATDDEVKKAYRKAALKNHPDKVPADQKDEATILFQRIAFAYAILSSPTRRKLYDDTGSTEESLHSDPDWSWSSFYRAQFSDLVTGDAIARFAAKYKGGEEERADVLRKYVEGEGDMDFVFSEVMLSNVLEDDERFRGIIDEAIEAGEAEEFEIYAGEKQDKKKKAGRRKKAEKEAEEAKKMAKKLGVHDKLFGGGGGEEDGETGKNKQKKGKKDAGESSLAALMQARQANNSSESFFDRLAEKYGAKEKKGTFPVVEEAFQAAAKRVEARRNGKRKVVDDDEEEEEEVTKPRKKAARNRAGR